MLHSHHAFRFPLRVSRLLFRLDYFLCHQSSCLSTFGDKTHLELTKLPSPKSTFAEDFEDSINDLVDLLMLQKKAKAFEDDLDKIIIDRPRKKKEQDGKEFDQASSDVVARPSSSYVPGEVQERRQIKRPYFREFSISPQEILFIDANSKTINEKVHLTFALVDREKMQTNLIELECKLQSAKKFLKGMKDINMILERNTDPLSEDSSIQYFKRFVDLGSLFHLKLVFGKDNEYRVYLSRELNKKTKQPGVEYFKDEMCIPASALGEFEKHLEEIISHEVPLSALKNEPTPSGSDAKAIVDVGNDSIAAPRPEKKPLGDAEAQKSSENHPQTSEKRSKLVSRPQKLSWQEAVVRNMTQASSQKSENKAKIARNQKIGQTFGKNTPRGPKDASRIYVKSTPRLDVKSEAIKSPRESTEDRPKINQKTEKVKTKEKRPNGLTEKPKF